MDDSVAEFSKKEKRALHREQKAQEQKGETRANAGKKLLTLVGIVAVVGLIGFGLSKLSDPNTSFSPPLSQGVEEIDQVLGKDEATATLVEYGDYECPGCASYAPIVSEAANKYPDDVKIVYRHFPIPGHLNSVPASQAAEAAALQGKFWEMHELLFAARNEWMGQTDPKPMFEQMATFLELDIEKFKVDYESDAVKQKIARDEQTAIDSAVDSTPTFFINNKKVERLPQNPDAFFKLLEDAIAKSKTS